jgi:hypothetical protein
MPEPCDAKPLITVLYCFLRLFPAISFLSSIVPYLIDIVPLYPLFNVVQHTVNVVFVSLPFNGVTYRGNGVLCFINDVPVLVGPVPPVGGCLVVVAALVIDVVMFPNVHTFDI